MKQRNKFIIAASFLLSAFTLSIISWKPTNLTEVKADPVVNATYYSIYSDDYNNGVHTTGYNRLMLRYTGTAHGNPATVSGAGLSVFDGALTLNGNNYSTYAEGATQVYAWTDQLWILFIYPEDAVSVGSVLTVNEGFTFGNAVFEKMVFKLNSNQKWDYCFDEPVNSTYKNIYSDDWNNTETGTGTGFNKILVTYAGTAHGDPATITVANTLKKYDTYVLIDGMPLSSFAGSQIAPWGGQPWIQFIYPATAVSVGSVLTINSGCKIGNTVLEKIEFKLNANQKWEYYFGIKSNAYYNSIYSDDYNNAEHIDGYNKLMVRYNGPAHGNPGAVVLANELKKYDGYVLINGNPISSYAGGATQIYAWTDQLWAMVIYPSTAVSEGSILTINEGCKIGDAALNKMVFELNSSGKWELVDGVFLVSFDANGGVGSMASSEEEFGDYTLPACTFAAPDEYAFNGWKINGHGDLLQPGDKINLSSCVNLVVQWIATVGHISFNANGGTGSMVEVKQDLGEYTIPECTFTPAENYVFIGWKINDQGNLLQPGDIINLTDDIELVAQWKLPYTGIALLWNNAHYGNLANYNQLILEFGTYGTNYLANSHNADSTNRATNTFDIGNKLTINNIPIYKIHDKYPETKVTYDHGNDYLYVQYPTDILLMNKNCLVPTLHIKEGTEFMDTHLSEVNLKLVGGIWIDSTAEDFKLDESINLSDYATTWVVDYITTDQKITFPHKIGAEPHPILVNLPENGCKMAFTLNTGDIDIEKEFKPGETGNVLMINGLYKCLVVINFNAKYIQLCDLEAGSTMVQQYTNFTFAAHTDYLFEFDINCGVTTTFKMAINHYVIFDYTFASNKSDSAALWAVDYSNKITMNNEKDIIGYLPKIENGASYYDFMEGDPVYDFASVFDIFDLYNDSLNHSSLRYQYEEGAVTNDKYNVGNWKLTIKVNDEGYEKVIKVINIVVHGKTSIAKVCFGQSDPINVVIGDKLEKPTDPSSYSEGEYDYVFDGWYFEGAKWNFDKDVVQGDMQLIAKFKPIEHRYKVTVKYEGIEGISKVTNTYLLSKNSSLPFDTLFALEGATYEVYLGNDKITSLEVTNDISITVKYTVVYTYVAPHEVTCTEDGNIGYWCSPVYPGYYFADSKGREVMNKDEVITPKLGHDIVHLEAKDSTCSELGNVDCYYCKNCHKHFEDASGEHELIDWSIPMKQHNIIHHDAVPATCDEDGNIEYWTCENEPGVYYIDENCTIKVESVIVSAHGHEYQNPTYTWQETEDGYICIASMKCAHCEDEITETKEATKVVVREATCSQEGQISYSVKFDDERFSAQTKIVTTPKTMHDYVFVPQVDATPEKDGVKEHYKCSECHKYFIKNDSGEYIEVQYSDLLIKYIKPKKCGGDIAATSLLLSASAGMLVMLLMLKRKKEE